MCSLFLLLPGCSNSVLVKAASDDSAVTTADSAGDDAQEDDVQDDEQKDTAGAQKPHIAPRPKLS